jgi:hypothetical protein
MPFIRTLLADVLVRMSTTSVAAIRPGIRLLIFIIPSPDSGTLGIWKSLRHQISKPASPASLSKGEGADPGVVSVIFTNVLARDHFPPGDRYDFGHIDSNTLLFDVTTKLTHFAGLLEGRVRKMRHLPLKPGGTWTRSRGIEHLARFGRPHVARGTSPVVRCILHVPTYSEATVFS